jgi:hypothetical protein
MAAVLESLSSVLLCVYCWEKGSLLRIFMKKRFLFMVGSVCRVKRFTTGWQTFRWWRRGRNGGANVAETTVRRLQCFWFRRTGKAMGPVYQCWWRICREINIFFLPGSNINMLYVLYPFVIYLLTLPRMNNDILRCDIVQPGRTLQIAPPSTCLAYSSTLRTDELR